VRRAAVLTHGDPARIGSAIARVQSVAREAGVELLIGPDEAVKHGLGPGADDARAPDIAVVLGGDGTMLRALTRFLGTGVPVIGVNFGRVGFLSSISRTDLETGLARVFAGEVEVVELATLEVEVNGERRVAVNDVVVASGVLGRMVELEWSLGGEALGRVPCDGVICATPSGSTAYNLSNGGPVLMWGIDAMAITFVAPHALDVRPFVAPRGRDLIVWNRTPDVPVAVLVDGHRLADAPPGGRALVRLGPERTLLATLPEATFVRRYRTSFAP
jgi:NAD+ kinase